jgi:hypothetical protein
MHFASGCIVVAELLTSKNQNFSALAERIDHTLANLDAAWANNFLEAPRRVENRLQIGARLLAASKAFDFAVALQLALWPLRLRVYATNAGQTDIDQTFGKSTAAFRGDFSGLSSAQAKMIEATAQLHAAILRDWKPSRAKAALAMRTAKNQNEAAADLGIRQQSVSEALRAGHARELIACENAIRACLEELES